MHKIPTISFKDLTNTDNEVLEFLTTSLENNGFFVINDHPVDLSLIKKVFLQELLIEDNQASI